MPVLKKNYLQRVKQCCPRLYYFIITFISLQLVLTIVKWQVFPFYLYGMYSEKMSDVSSCAVTQIKIDGEYFNYMSLHQLNKEMIVSPAERYMDIINHKDKFESYYKNFQRSTFIKKWARYLGNKEQTQLFEPWLKRYLEYSTGRKIKKVEICISTFNYKK